MHAVEYITLHKAAKLVPGGTSANAIWRWCRKGVLARDGQRVRLQHVRIGGKLYTTELWLTQFGQLLADADASYFRMDTGPTRPQPAPHPRTDSQRQAAVERAERELQEMGV
jgi:hypothetical protein